MTADLMGICPKELLLVGITGRTYEAGCELSAEVRKTVDLAIDVVRAELRRLDVPYFPASKHAKPDIWWTSGNPAAALT